MANMVNRLYPKNWFTNASITHYIRSRNMSSKSAPIVSGGRTAAPLAGPARSKDSSLYRIP